MGRYQHRQWYLYMLKASFHNFHIFIYWCNILGRRFNLWKLVKTDLVFCNECWYWYGIGMAEWHNLCVICHKKLTQTSDPFVKQNTLTFYYSQDYKCPNAGYLKVRILVSIVSMDGYQQWKSALVHPWWSRSGLCAFGPVTSKQQCCCLILFLFPWSIHFIQQIKSCGTENVTCSDSDGRATTGHPAQVFVLWRGYKIPEQTLATTPDTPPVTPPPREERYDNRELV